ncbi:Peroxisomal membrane protein 13 [Acorus gramineus]|uniref:Peroxin-13 n=1 Tax=Acorus gramineus TaxID=55184 RepID=A0AAV9BE61_ACOGR|nr:Peroxisomal membrane protein 13 [Acorus gramineus]
MGRRRTHASSVSHDQNDVLEMDLLGKVEEQTGNVRPPLKPWERAGNSLGPSPFKPPSLGSTSDAVEASGTAKPGEIIPITTGISVVKRDTLSRPVPTRPWVPNYGSNYGGFGYGPGLYNSSGGLNGNNLYNRGYGGMYGVSGLYGGGMFNNQFGGQLGGPYDDQDPNNPFTGPPSPPGFWISFLRMLQGVVGFIDRVAFLVDQNTQALHLFMTGLLQLFDRSGMLYGELARFVFNILGLKTKQRTPPPQTGQKCIEGPKAAPGAWDNVWGEGLNRKN